MTILDNHGIALTHRRRKNQHHGWLLLLETVEDTVVGGHMHLASTYSTVCFTAASAACFACHESWNKDLSTAAPISGCYGYSRLNTTSIRSRR